LQYYKKERTEEVREKDRKKQITINKKERVASLFKTAFVRLKNIEMTAIESGS
jgi:ArsR family metal-binding transcriptional regulator